MTELPEFWRTEVFHPLSVHFPIALLSIAFFFKFVALWSKKETWQFGGTVLLIIGVAGLWLSVYTGNLADGIVSRRICDPTVLKDHENMAYLTGWIFSAALLLDLLKPLLQKKLFSNKIKFLKVILIILLAAGVVALSYTGHLGATLVYQQAAGVHVPSGDCSEFQ